MGIKELLRRIFLIDLIKGLRLTFSYQRPSATYTEQYPRERPPVAERYRGAPRLNNHPETNETLCIACNLCSLACPENLIVVGWERTADRKKLLTTFTYDLSRCMFCGLCEDACPVDALELTQDFEIAHYNREGMIWDRKMLEEGPQPTRYRALNRRATPGSFRPRQLAPTTVIPRSRRRSQTSEGGISEVSSFQGEIPRSGRIDTAVEAH